ncbi:MAG: hypothetical protein VYE15_07170, partial [Myxococcota bacterium]|nr:hypothetical protein [Myxococcota bacterium]
VEKAQRVLRAVVPLIGTLPPSSAWSALEVAVMTHAGQAPEAATQRLALFLEDREYHGRKENS